MNRIAIDVDRDGLTGQYQVSIQDRAEGCGYRISGPRHVDTSKNIVTAGIDAHAADAIRRYLDRAFPPVATTAGDGRPHHGTPRKGECACDDRIVFASLDVDALALAHRRLLGVLAVTRRRLEEAQGHAVRLAATVTPPVSAANIAAAAGWQGRQAAEFVHEGLL